MTPWNNPGNLTRSWCIWELYSASLFENDVNINIIIPPTQVDPFRNELRKDPLQIMAKLGNIDINKAEAFDKKDQESILNAAKESKGGVNGVRESVIGPLRKWITKESMNIINQIEMNKLNGNDIDEKEYALMLNNVGLLLHDQGKHDEAESLYKQSLEIRKNIFGINHPDVATSLNNLAELYKSQGKYDEAEPLYKQSLEISKNIFGINHPDVASSLNNLAELYNSQGKYDKLKELLNNN